VGPPSPAALRASTSPESGARVTRARASSYRAAPFRARRTAYCSLRAELLQMRRS